MPNSTIDFDIWGSRGSRNLVPVRSAVSNNTSCYSLLDGQDLLVFDAGRGLAALGYAVASDKRFRRVKRIHLLITHAHMDHWEGLKDADWFWRRGNGLKVSILACAEALAAIRGGYAHPGYVALDLLARATVAELEYIPLSRGEARSVGRFALRTSPLNHYSGDEHSKHFLDTLGFRVSLRGGPTVSYLSDHEPTRETRPTEDAMVRGAHLAVLDSHFPDVRHHAHGHGSQEHTASLARRHAGVLFLAGHHGPSLTDAEIRDARRRHGRKLTNYRLAVEGETYRWSRRKGAFERARR